MTTPREPREPRDPYERDAPIWGGPPAGGWDGDPSGRDPYGGDPGYGEQRGGDDPGYDPGGYDPGRYDPGRYDPGAPTRGGYPSGQGPYGSEPEYGWQQPEYEPAGGYGAGPPPGVDPYRPEQQGRREPPWAPGYAPASRRSARKRRPPPWIPLAVAGAVVVVLLVLGFVTPGWFVTRVFDTAAVQNGVAKILTDDYGAEGVADVRCPENIGVAAGATFTCDATIDGDRVTVPVRVTDGAGRYEVGRPT